MLFGHLAKTLLYVAKILFLGGIFFIPHDINYFTHGKNVVICGKNVIPCGSLLMWIQY